MTIADTKGAFCRLNPLLGYLVNSRAGVINDYWLGLRQSRNKQSKKNHCQHKKRFH